MTEDPDTRADDVQSSRTETSEAARSAVEFPVVRKSPALTVERRREFYAWVGRADRIARIGRLVEGASRRAFEDSRAELEAIENQYSRQSRVEEFQVTAEVFGAHSMHREGDLEAVLAEMDPADIIGVSVSNHRPMAHAWVRLGRQYADGPAAVIKVSGADPQWVAGTFDQLVSEVSKGVPAWAGLRKRAVAVGASLFAVVAFVGVLIAVQGVSFGSQGRPISPAGTVAYRVLLAAIASLVASLAGAGVFALVRRWVLVPFEVLEPGKKSTARRIGGVVGWVIGVASGLIAIGSLAASLLQ